MNLAVWILIAVGGGIGACLRFIIDGLITRHVRSGFPWGILVINVVGSLILGLFTGLAGSSILDVHWLVILGGGVIGGFTTFSTAMVDTVKMLERRTWGRFAANAFGMLVLAVAAAMLGLALGRAV